MLKQGDKAPAFALESDAGTRVSSADFAGRRLVVYFYPKDNTPGCTRESIAFSEALAKLAAAGAAVVGVSRDSVKSHGSFRDKYALKVPLLSDPDLALHKAFGVWGEKTMYGKKVQGTIRSTFIVGADGAIERAFPGVKVDGHVEQVLAALTGAAPAPAEAGAKPAKPAKPAKAAPAAKRAAAAKPAKPAKGAKGAKATASPRVSTRAKRKPRGAGR